ncbi:MAG TPA: thioredoxin domain-containing protein, partial [Cryomorphaceae bacterium]|nr:thioredoxin domain-containing protein [Cryomorphaceae bacterium]
MNQLARSHSAYLLQHAHNPVDWWPWGAEALEAAAAQGQWLLVSIGYSTCHWCHVMEHEIFEDQECAEFMNAHFKNIKIDREERPDVDHAYMQAALALNGQGGWPLNVICLPDGRPVWASTYLPKDRWLGALERLVAVQQNQEGVAGPYAQRLTEALEA